MTNSVALAIKVTADASQAAAGIDGVTTKTSKMGQAGALAGKALAAGLLVAGAAAIKAAQAAAEDETAQVKLAGALKNATGARASDIASVESWITAQGRALGVADDQLRPALESLVTATGNVAKAQDLAGVAMDISARKGLSLESVAKSLAKAQATGSVGALAKYGVATKDAEGKTRSLEAVQKDLAAMYTGAAASSADTLAGRQKKLAVQVDELKEKFGAKLTPALESAAAAGIKVVDWIDQNETAAIAIAATLGTVLAVTYAVSVATRVWAAATTIATAAQWLFNAAMSANPVVLIVIAVVALAAALVLAYKKSETFRAIVDGVFNGIKATVSAVVDFIKNNWQKMLIILTGPIGIAVALIVTHWGTIKAGASAVVGFIKEKFTAVKDALAGPVEKAKELIGTAIDGVKTAIQSVKTKVDDVAGLIKSGLEGAFAPFGAVLSVIQSVIDKVQDLIDKIQSIPTPDLNPLNRSALGSSGNGTNDIFGGHSPRGGQTVNLTVNVPGGFIGDEVALMRRIRQGLDADLRRLARA